MKKSSSEMHQFELVDPVSRDPVFSRGEVFFSKPLKALKTMKQCPCLPKHSSLEKIRVTNSYAN